MPHARTMPVLVTLALLVATIIASAPNALSQEKQPGLWEPPPMPVQKAVEALSGITVGHLRQMQDHQLTELSDIARTSVEVIALELKRRAHRAGRRDDSRAKGLWVPNDGYVSSGLVDDGTRPGRWRVDEGYSDSGLTYDRTSR